VGTLATLLSLLVLPFLWVLPQALMTAELSTMIDLNGGAILWVTQAFGSLAGWQVSYLTQLSAVVDTAIYPVFFTDYLGSAVSLEYYQLWLIRFAVVIAGTLLNLRGVNVVTWMSALIAAVILLPFIAEVCVLCAMCAVYVYVYVYQSVCTCVRIHVLLSCAYASVCVRQCMYASVCA
jgi:amino acid transporter